LIHTAGGAKRSQVKVRSCPPIEAAFKGSGAARLFEGLACVIDGRTVELMRAKIPVAFGAAIGVAVSEVVRHGIIHIRWVDAGIALLVAVAVVIVIPARFFEKMKR